MSYSYYLTVKDKACICYEGHNIEYLVQLRMAKADLQRRFPEIKFTYAFKPEYLEYFGEGITVSEYWANKSQFAFCHHLLYDAASRKHPVVKLLADSKVVTTKVKTEKPRSSVVYVSVLGDFPNSNLNEEQVKKASMFATKKGFKPQIIDRKLGWEEAKKIAGSAAYIVGAANELLYEAVAAGTPTALIPTGNGTEEAYRLFAELPNVLP